MSIPVVLFGLVFDIEFLILIMNFKSNLFCEVLLLTFEMWLNLRPLMGFSQKECTSPPLLRVSIFSNWSPWISSWFYHENPETFLFFTLTASGNPLSFSELRHTPWNSNNFYIAPWNFPLILSTDSLQIFFWAKLKDFHFFPLVREMCSYTTEMDCRVIIGMP